MREREREIWHDCNIPQALSRLKASLPAQRHPPIGSEKRIKGTRAAHFQCLDNKQIRLIRYFLTCWLGILKIAKSAKAQVSAIAGNLGNLPSQPSSKFGWKLVFGWIGLLRAREYLVRLRRRLYHSKSWNPIDRELELPATRLVWKRRTVRLDATTLPFDHKAELC